MREPLALPMTQRLTCSTIGIATSRVADGAAALTQQLSTLLRAASRHARYGILSIRSAWIMWASRIRGGFFFKGLGSGVRVGGCRFSVQVRTGVRQAVQARVL